MNEKSNVEDNDNILGSFIGTPQEMEPFLREERVKAWDARTPKVFLSATLDKLSSSVVGDISFWEKERKVSPGTNFIFIGPRGVGKTFAAYAVLRKEFFEGKTVAAWQTVDLLDALRPGGDDNSERISEMISTVDILLLDDLGATKTTDWTLERFSGLIDRRYREMLPTIVTTNLDFGSVTEVLGSRATDRLYGGAVQTIIGGDSRRKFA